jgi:hypothetical protein
MFIPPVELLFIQTALVPLPPRQLPVMFNVPVDKLFAACANVAEPPVQFPTIDAVAGDEAENSKQLIVVVVLLCVTFAVSVTPSLMTNFPVPALLISSQVALAVMVTVCPVEARASSPTVGTTPPTHVAPALKLPLAADTMSAMAQSPFA